MCVCFLSFTPHQKTKNKKQQLRSLYSSVSRNNVTRRALSLVISQPAVSSPTLPIASTREEERGVAEVWQRGREEGTHASHRKAVWLHLISLARLRTFLGSARSLSPGARLTPPRRRNTASLRGVCSAWEREREGAQGREEEGGG